MRDGRIGRKQKEMGPICENCLSDRKGKSSSCFPFNPQWHRSCLKDVIRSGCTEKIWVAADNKFVFASTQLSDLNFSGWHAMKDICAKWNLENPTLLNTTNNRHRTSTLYAALDISEKERELFYTHMGHSSEMNRDAYQTPLALLGITKVGKELLQFEAGKVCYD